MVSFFETLTGTLIPRSRIWSIGASPEKLPQDIGIKTYSVRLDNADGQTVSISSYERGRITAGPRHFIPALPDTYTLGTVHHDYSQQGEVWRTPVIAWAFNEDGEVAAVTASGLDDPGSAQTVLLPDGSVTESGDERWRTFDGWFGDMLREAKAKAKQEAAPNG